MRFNEGVDDDFEFIRRICDADFDSKFRKTETIEDVVALYEEIKDFEDK